jgi:hypothetical protein
MRGWASDFFGEEFDGVPNPFRLGFGDVYAPASVMFRGRVDVESKGPMWCPGAAFGALVVYDYPDARRGNRGSVVVKLAIELSFRRESGIDAGVAEEIQD